MANVTPQRILIQTQGAQFRAAVSESLIQGLGASINFINLFQHSEKQFFINGNYQGGPFPQDYVDGLVIFEYNATIINVWMFVETAGSAGTTELDLQIATASGGSFASIFSTTPKITSAAGNGVWVGVGGSGTGLTAPILTSTSVNAGTAMKLKIVQSQTGNPNGTGLLVHYQPR